jgi:hypothetical protein
VSARDAFPREPRELLAMFACYLLTAALGAMVLMPREFAHLVIGLLP